MLDIKFVAENKDKVKENIKKKFQDQKLPLVDEVVELYEKVRKLKVEGDELRSKRNSISNNIGALVREKKFDDVNKAKDEVKVINEKLIGLEKEEQELNTILKAKMMVIPNIIDASVPVGKDDSENVEVERFGEAVVPAYEIPYHADIINSLNSQIEYLREKRKMEVKAQISKVPIKISIISVLFFVPLILMIILAPVLLSYIS